MKTLHATVSNYLSISFFLRFIYISISNNIGIAVNYINIDASKYYYYLPDELLAHNGLDTQT